MIPGCCFFPNRGLDKGSSLRETINALGLTSGLKLLLDAGDRASVASASQTKWLDIAGNGYDFNRGSGSGSDSADPTFNGTIGRQSSGEFYSSDGGDYFTYDSANETWMQNLHKNNARLSLAAWVNIPSAQTMWLISTQFAVFTQVGTTLTVGDDATVFNVGNGSGRAFTVFDGPALPAAAWAFVGVSVNEAANSCIMNISGATYSGSCTYSSPSSGSAVSTMSIGSPGGTAFMPSGSKVSNLAMWEGASLTAAQLAALFTATRGKFGV